MAFVNTAAPLVARSSFTSSAVSAVRPTVRLARPTFATRMALQTKEKQTQKQKTSSFSRTEDNRRAKLAAEDRGPQGFTPYAERVNGRIAQMGFVIGLITELASGKTINEQILIMFSPLTNLVVSLLHLSS